MPAKSGVMIPIGSSEKKVGGYEWSTEHLFMYYASCAF